MGNSVKRQRQVVTFIHLFHPIAAMWKPASVAFLLTTMQNMKLYIKIFIQDNITSEKGLCRHVYILFWRKPALNTQNYTDKLQINTCQAFFKPIFQPDVPDGLYCQNHLARRRFVNHSNSRQSQSRKSFSAVLCSSINDISSLRLIALMLKRLR